MGSSLCANQEDSQLHVSVLSATLLRVAMSAVPFHYWYKSLALAVPSTYRSMKIRKYVHVTCAYIFVYTHTIYTHTIHIHTRFFNIRVYIHMAYALPFGRFLIATVYQHKKVYAGVSTHAPRVAYSPNIATHITCIRR